MVCMQSSEDNFQDPFFFPLLWVLRLNSGCLAWLMTNFTHWVILLTPFAPHFKSLFLSLSLRVCVCVHMVTRGQSLVSSLKTPSISFGLVHSSYLGWMTVEPPGTGPPVSTSPALESQMYVYATTPGICTWTLGFELRSHVLVRQGLYWMNHFYYPMYALKAVLCSYNNKKSHKFKFTVADVFSSVFSVNVNRLFGPFAVYTHQNTHNSDVFLLQTKLFFIWPPYK